MTSDRIHRPRVSGPRRARIAGVMVLAALLSWVTACPAGEGPALFEMPAWAALGIGLFETLLVLAGLAAAWWLLSRGE